MNKKLEFILVGLSCPVLMVNAVFAIAGAASLNYLGLTYIVAIGNIMILILFILLLRKYQECAKK